MWKGIELGKKLGYTQYDFFGIAPTTIDEQGEYHYDQKHQYAGVTRFKLGFGGKIQLTPGTFDIILKPTLYSLYQTVRKLRRLI
jgi:lipid II:glycine glycyltransferase (peptidoglycan interpeptide bridge formation enzyme)